MTVFDDPNREAVGVEPIWTAAGDGGETDPKVTTMPAAFDPGEHTVAEVQAYLDEHPEEYDAVIDAETAGRNRATLTG